MDRKLKKHFTPGTVFAICLLVAACTYIITLTTVTNELNAEVIRLNEERTEIEKFFKAREIIQKSYVGEVDEDALLDGAIEGMVDALGDPYSRYYSAKQYERVSNDPGNQYVGIGLTVTQDDGGLLVVDVYDGSPAAQAGIAPRDVIVKIDNRDIATANYDEALAMLGGDEGTKVSLTLYRASDDSTVTLSVERRISTRRAVSSEILEGPNLGIVRILHFEEGVDLEFNDAVRKLQNAHVSGIIFDVRNNPGGLAAVLCSMLDTLLPEGTIMTIRGKGDNDPPRTSDALCVDLPMAVLINERTYSAAELFAAVLQEYTQDGLADVTLIGEKTTGKGFAQTPNELPDKAVLWLSTREYFTPHGASLADTGVVPDEVIVLTQDEKERFSFLTFEQDRQLQAAIRLLSE